MIKKTFSVCLVSCLLFISHTTYALSLGDIAVYSHFAQPFRAAIDIPVISEEEMGSLNVSFASKKEYRKRNIFYSGFLKDVKLSIEKNDQGKTQILIQSDESIKDLSITFLIELEWSGGRIIKMYDVLITPEAVSRLLEEKNSIKSKPAEVGSTSSTFAQTAPAPLIETPVSIVKQFQTAEPQKPASIAQQFKTEEPKKPVSIVQQFQQKKAEQTKLANNTPASETSSANNQPSSPDVVRLADGTMKYHSVKRGDTLSQIAQKIRPDQSMGIHQVMYKLFEENRNAFLGDRIDRLKAGVSLTLKDFDSIIKMSRQEARKLLATYSKSLPKQTNQADIAVATLDIDQKLPKMTDDKLLKIAAVDEQQIFDSQIQEKLRKKDIAITENKLTNKKNTLRKLNEENEALRQRIRQLESEIDHTAEKLFISTIEGDIIEPDVNSPSESVQTSFDADETFTFDSNLPLDSTDEIANEADSEQNADQDNITLYGGIAIVLLSLILIGIRKKETILDIIEDYKIKRANKRSMFRAIDQ